MTNASAAQGLSVHNTSQNTLVFFSAKVYMDLILQNPIVPTQPFTLVNEITANIDNPFVGKVYLIQYFK